MDHSPVRFSACAVLAMVLALPAMSEPARAGDDEYASVREDEETVANMFAFGNLAVSVATFDSAFDGKGNTHAGLLTMAFGGISMAAGLNEDHSMLAAAGAMSFVAGLASVAMSLTAKPASRAAVTAEPFVATIAGQTHVGLTASIRY